MNGREKGSGKRSNRKTRGANPDEVPSVTTDDAYMADAAVSSKNEDGEEMTWEDKQDQMVEQLAEKRTSTRMSALSRLVDQLQVNVEYDFVSERLDTLVMYLLQSVKKGDAAEVLLACQALSLIAVTLGAESDKLVAEVSPSLQEYIKNSSKGGAGRAAVAECIGFITFLGSSNDVDTMATMNLMLEQLKLQGLPEALACSAWEAWGLMASTLPTHKLGGELLELTLPSLVNYLDHESVDVKTAAGQCIALMWEAKQAIDAEKAAEAGEEPVTHELSEDEELTPLPGPAIPTMIRSVSNPGASTRMTDAVADSPVLSASTRSPAIRPAHRPAFKPKSSAFSQATTASSRATSSSSVLAPKSHVVDPSQLIAKLHALAKDSGRYQSKKSRASQKKNFREFLRTVEDGDVPEESLKIEKSRHEFVGWVHNLQLDAIRDIIGKGLNTHMVHNTTLQEIFELFIESGDGVDDPNRKAASRAQSKIKERENFESRTKNRKKKQAMANAFGMNDD